MQMHHYQHYFTLQLLQIYLYKYHYHQQQHNQHFQFDLFFSPPPDLNLAIVPAVPVISPRLLYVVESDEPSAFKIVKPNPPIISNLAALINPFYLM
jgi:hypothetical protein